MRCVFLVWRLLWLRTPSIHMARFAATDRPSHIPTIRLSGCIAPNSGNVYGLNPTCAHADAMLPFIIISNPDVPICEYMQQSAGVCGCKLQGSVSCGITRCSASSDSFQPEKMINANGFGFGGLSSFFNDPNLAFSLVEMCFLGSSLLLQSIARLVWIPLWL